MKRSSSKWLSIRSVSSAVVFFGGAALLLMMRHIATRPISDHPTLIAIGHEYQNEGVMSESDYQRLREMEKVVGQRGHMTDAEFDWLQGLMQRPLQKKPYASALAHARPMAIMLDAKLSPGQQAKLFNIALPLLRSHDPDADDLDKIFGCNAMIKLRNKRAVPYILPLLNDDRPKVLAKAKKALSVLGYKTL